MHGWEYIALFGSALAGGGLAFWVRGADPKILRMVMTLTGAYIFGITLVHLLPDIFRLEEPWAGTFILLGFLLQIGVEHLSQGIEHGHVHRHEGHGHHGAGLAVSVLLGLSIHCFLEGMPVTGYETIHELGHHHGHDHGDHRHNYLLYGIMSHKVPAAFALVTMLLAGGFRFWPAFGLLALYASMSPLGALSAEVLQRFELLNGRIFVLIMALVVGSFLHISTTILFENEEKNHAFDLRKTLSLLVGFGLALASH
jgi:zinc transporter ZupT